MVIAASSNFSVKRRAILFLVLVCSCARLLAGDSTSLPKTGAELNRWCPEPPAGKNAAVVFMQGFAIKNITNEDYSNTNLPWLGKAGSPAIDRPLSLSTSNAIKNFLSRNEAAFNLFRQAAAIKESRYPWDLTLGPDALLPYLTGLRGASKMLALYALGHANGHEGEKAAEGLMVQCALIESLESEPILVSQQIRAECVTYILFGLTQMLNRVAMPAESLNKIEERLEALEKKEAEGYGFKRGLVGLRVLIKDYFDMPPEKMAAWFKSNTISWMAPQASEPYPRKPDEQFSAESISLILNAWNAPYPDRFRKVDDLCNSSLVRAETNKYPISAGELRWISAAVEKEAISLRCFRLMKTAIALQQYAQDHGNKYPDNLAQLVPVYLKLVPEDPIDGQRLRYTKSGRGYAIWGVRQKENTNLFNLKTQAPWEIRVIASPEHK